MGGQRMSTNKTENLSLHSWVGSDGVDLGEINENFSKIDGKLGELSKLTVQTAVEMKQDTKLKENTVVRTLGYFEIGDGGAAEYVVRKTTLTTDDGSVIALQNNLQAHLVKPLSVNYKMFGAIGDGVNNDGVQIKNAHQYAYENKLPVINMTGEYWIKDTYSIIFGTNTNLGQTVLHIDESFNTKTQRFLVPREGSAISLPTDVREAIIPKIVKGQFHIEELAPYKNHMIVVQDSNDRIGRRSGSGSGWAKEDFFYVEEYGRIVTDIAFEFSALTSATAYPVPESYLTIEGGTFLLSGDNSDGTSTATYLHNGFVVNRSRTIIKNQFVGLEHGQRDVALDMTSAFYTFSLVFDVTLENVRLIPREKNRPSGDAYPPVQEGTYGIGGSRVLNATFRNVTAEGTGIHWGVFGTNLFKNFRVENCQLNRIDVHFMCHNLYVYDTQIGDKGFTITGSGDLFVERTKVIGQTFIGFRSDYGSKWEGHIRLKQNTLVVVSPTSGARILQFNTQDTDYWYDITWGKTIVIEDFTLDYQRYPYSIAQALPIYFSGATKTSERRINFPESIVLKDIRCAGRETGVELLYITNPSQYKLPKKYELTPNGPKTNASLIIDNVHIEKYENPTPQSASSSHIWVGGLNTTEYLEDAWVPKIEIRNIADPLIIQTKGSICSLVVKDSAINLLDMYEGGRGRVVSYFENCIFKPVYDPTSNNYSAYYANTEYGFTFVNCTWDIPVVNGVETPEDYGILWFVRPNEFVRHKHIGSEMSKAYIDAMATAGDPILPEFINVLMSAIPPEGTATSGSITRALRKSGTTEQRPGNRPTGFVYYDTDLNREVIWNGTDWKFASPTLESAIFHIPAGYAVGDKFQINGTGKYIVPRDARITLMQAWASELHATLSTYRYKVFVNGVAIENGQEWYAPAQTSSSNPTNTYISQNITVKAGDIVELEISTKPSGTTATSEGMVSIVFES
jgi:hypothetical protein